MSERIKPVNIRASLNAEEKPKVVYLSSTSRIKTQSITPEIVQDLRDLGFRMSRMELLKRRNEAEAERRLRSGDPPCCVCGTWSNQWLCPDCRRKYPWMTAPMTKELLKCQKKIQE